MNLTSLLQELRYRGVTLSREAGALKMEGAKGAVTAKLRTALLEHKHALLEYLQSATNDIDAQLPQCELDPDNLYEPFPLSDLQLGFYLANDPHMEFHVRPHYYQEKNVVDLDVARYEAAWNKMLRRHQRELVSVRADGYLETIKNPEPLRCQVLDLRDRPSEEVASSLEQTRQQMMRAELSLNRWPWHDVRISLWRDQGTECARIHYNHNSFFSDGFGTSRALQEIDQYYHNPAHVLPPLALSYRDAILALDRLENSTQGLAARRYWEERIPNLPGPPALPMRAGMERRCRSRLKQREKLIDAHLWRAFKAHAVRFGVTPSNAVFAVYAEILSAWCNSRHFVLSNMMTRRLNVHPEIYDILGNFVSLYPLEIDLRTRESFAEHANTIQQQVMRDNQHRQWGGMRVMQALNQQAGGFGRAPLPFVIASGLWLDAWRRSDYGCLETPQVMLDHQFFELPDGRLQILWDLLEEFFPDGLIDTIWRAHVSLIERLALDATLWETKCFDVIPSSQLELRHQVTPLFRRLSEKCLHDFLNESTALNPNQLALVTQDCALTYEELRQGANVIAGWLRNAGVRRGHTVAVVADRGPSLLKAVYGILKVGAAYIPIDPSLPEERRTYLLQNSEAKQVITESKYAEQISWSKDTSVLVADRIDSYSHMDNVDSKIDDTSLAYIIYTSGSTGQPKGVMIDHRGAVNTILDVNQRFQVGPEDRLFGVSSFGFDLSVYDLFGSVAAGATLIYPDPDQALNPAHWLDVLQTQRVSIWNSAPPLASLLVEAAEYRGVLLHDLRLVLLSGDWIPVDLPERLRKIAPNVKVISMGGATEASIWSILYEIDHVDPAWVSIPYGYPMQNQSWFVLDEMGRPAPEWVAGDLYIGGIGLALGYWRDPAKTAANFISHPHTGERIYRTGDIGRYLPSGAIEFLGRKDFQVKIQGHRIELGEIESMLLSCPDVVAAVVDVQPSTAGTARQLAAYIVPATGVVLQPDDLRRILSKKLPDYMVPRLIQFLDQLPLTSNGKIDRKALPRIDGCKMEATTLVKREPQDDIESALLTIWGRALKRDKIGVTDDFFELGGQSLEAVRMVGLIRETFGTSLSLGDIWQDRTVERLAQRLRVGETASPAQCLVEINRAGSGSTLFLVHPAGGHVLCYRDIGMRLGRPVFAFQAPGVDGRTPPLESIPKFAETYLEYMRDIPSQEPILLGGWSSGALIAYEMATQLRSQGRPVKGVIIIDSPAPLVHEPISDHVLFDWFLGDLNLKPSTLAALGELPRAGRTETQLLVEAAAVMREHGAELGADTEQLAAIYRVFKGVVRASRNYQAKATDIDLMILRAQQGVVGEFARHPFSEHEDWGWRTFTTGRVSATSINGTHYTLLSSPAVQAVATTLAGWMADRENKNL